MTIWICLGCRERVVATKVPRHCAKCHSPSAWFRPYEPPRPEIKQQVVNGIRNAHPTAQN